MSDLAHYESTLEKIITEHLTDNGWLLGDKTNYDRGVGLDRVELFKFLKASQNNSLQKLFQLHGNEEKAKQKLVERLIKEIESNGIIHVLRKGITDLGVKVYLAYFIPENFLSDEGIKEYEANRVTVTRQIKMSETNVNDSIDLTFLLNGLPVATAELKAQTAGQNVKDAMKQFRFDRKPNDLIFSKRSLVNFAIDENDVFMTTKLQGASTVFLPFNQGTAGGGSAGGKGNPLDPNGEKTGFAAR
jgi:type I restriction enzyme R subunit